MTQTWIEEFSFSGAFLLWVKIRNPSLLLKHRCPIALTYQGGRIQISAFTSLFRFSMRKISGSKASWLLPWPNIWVFFISSLSFKKMFPVVAKEISFFVASQLLFPSGLYSRRLFPLVSVLLMRWTSSWDSRVAWLGTRIELSSFQLISFSHIHPRRPSPLRWSHLVQLEWWKRCKYPL